MAGEQTAGGVAGRWVLRRVRRVTGEPSRENANLRTTEERPPPRRRACRVSDPRGPDFARVPLPRENPQGEEDQPGNHGEWRPRRATRSPAQTAARRGQGPTDQTRRPPAGSPAGCPMADPRWGRPEFFLPSPHGRVRPGASASVSREPCHTQTLSTSPAPPRPGRGANPSLSPALGGGLGQCASPLCASPPEGTGTSLPARTALTRGRWEAEADSVHARRARAAAPSSRPTRV